MTVEQWEKLQSLYNQARQLSSAERSAFLITACGDDERLRQEVESLLEHGDRAGDFLEKPALVSAAASFTGRRIAHYDVGNRIGAGGMGQVYRAHDTKLGRDVAIKVLPASFALDPERLLRFEREARVLAALNHSHIAAIYGLEEANGVPALILELVEGPTLADRVAAGPIPISEALPLAQQIAEALEAAHAKSIIHRDLKPANIKIASDGMLKVLDFGLAKAFSGDGSDSDLSKLPTLTTDRTRDGRILGTPAYMSPEQARGQTVDKRTDIWAFGCVLYHVLTGRMPFVGETVSDTISAVLGREPDWCSGRSGMEAGSSSWAPPVNRSNGSAIPGTTRPGHLMARRSFIPQSASRAQICAVPPPAGSSWRMSRPMRTVC